MNYLTDRNEPQRRHWALLLTIALHLGLGIALYMSASSPSTGSSAPVIKGKTELAAP